MKIKFALLTLCLCLGGCLIRPYQFDITQGNVITPDKISQVQPGMSEEQVRYILGTSMLQDVFHPDRWDYVYYEKPGHKKPKEHHVTIYFFHGAVEKVFSDEVV